MPLLIWRCDLSELRRVPSRFHTWRWAQDPAKKFSRMKKVLQRVPDDSVQAAVLCQTLHKVPRGRCGLRDHQCSKRSASGRCILGGKFRLAGSLLLAAQGALSIEYNLESRTVQAILARRRAHWTGTNSKKGIIAIRDEAHRCATACNIQPYCYQ
eukprot:4124307-Amphidinium_carterae.1